MSGPRFISPLLCLAIFFANACCLYHASNAQGSIAKAQATNKHSCCKKAAQSDEPHKTPDPKKGCACCKRTAATAPQGSTHLQALSHFSLDTFAIADQSIQGPIAVSHTGSIVGLSPPPNWLDVLHQSCTLIL
jgi:hypothetical protein